MARRPQPQRIGHLVLNVRDLFSKEGTLYLIAMMVVASVAVLAIWRPGSEEKP